MTCLSLSIEQMMFRSTWDLLSIFVAEGGFSGLYKVGGVKETGTHESCVLELST